MAGPQFMRQVLIVEDDFAFADVLAEVLTHENCIPDHASNGMDALQKIRAGNYDAIICDLIMPRVDGETLYRQVEREFPYLADRFIFVTGRPTIEAGLADFVHATGNPLLIKPFDIEQLQTALRELLQR